MCKLICTAILAAVTAFAAGCVSSDIWVELSSKEYNGEFNQNKVQIIDVNYQRGAFSRTVRLHPSGQPGHVGVMGHGSRVIGQWHEVFYCGTPKGVNGCEAIACDVPGKPSRCNSIIFNRMTGAWDFNPCPSDKGKMEPFTDEQIFSAIGELNLAMGEIHKDVHLTRTWTNPDPNK